MLKELGRKVVIVALVIGGIWAALKYGPDMRSSTEVAADARIDRLRTAAKSMSKGEFITDYAKAMGYAERCGLRFSKGDADMALRAAGVSDADADLKGVYRAQVEDGIRTVVVLTSTSERKTSGCALAKAAYGPEGTILPGLLWD